MLLVFLISQDGEYIYKWDLLRNLQSLGLVCRSRAKHLPSMEVALGFTPNTTIKKSRKPDTLFLCLSSYLHIFFFHSHCLTLKVSDTDAHLDSSEAELIFVFFHILSRTHKWPKANSGHFEQLRWHKFTLLHFIGFCHAFRLEQFGPPELRINLISWRCFCDTEDTER